MKQLILFFFICAIVKNTMGQTYTSGLTATGTGTSTDVRLGGANPLLVNTTVDLGTYTFGFKKLTADYFTILNNGNIGVNNSNPTYKLDVTGTGRFTGDVLINGMTLGMGGGTVARNTVFGYQAGQLNTTGTENNFIGYQAGSKNTTGSYNYIFGNEAGFNNTTGSYNNFISYQAGYNNIDGNANNFIGYNAGFSNTTGSYNNFIGSNAGFNNTTGQGNVFISRYTGFNNTTGNYNSLIGYSAGETNTTGSYNTFFGYQTGRNNSDGSTTTVINNSVLLGTYAKAQGNNQTNQIAIGYAAIGDGRISYEAVVVSSSIIKTCIPANKKHCLGQLYC